MAGATWNSSRKTTFRSGRMVRVKRRAARRDRASISSFNAASTPEADGAQSFRALRSARAIEQHLGIVREGDDGEAVLRLQPTCHGSERAHHGHHRRLDQAAHLAQRLARPEPALVPVGALTDELSAGL